MSKESKGFNEKQINQLTDLFNHQRKSTVGELTEYVDQRFIEERKYIDQRFIEERKYIGQCFVEERAAIRQIIQVELQEIRDHLDKIELKIENDTKVALDEIKDLKKRVSALERKFA